MKYLFAFILSLHGLIHLMGFAKAFDLAQLNQLTKAISKPIGIAWRITTLIFLVTAASFLLKKDLWWLVAITGALLSQILIILFWQDAKFGTIPNIVILLVVVPAWAAWHFENQYKRDVTENLSYTNYRAETLLTTDAISPLPEPVQRYIIYSGAIGKPILTNF